MCGSHKYLCEGIQCELICITSLARYPDTWRIGFSAVSPSGKRIATMNLKDGVDFYSMSHKKFITSTKLPTFAPQGIATQITFVDDDTVAIGHSGGMIYFATFRMDQSVITFPLSQETETREIAGELTLPFIIVCTYQALVTNSQACPMYCQSKFIHSCASDTEYSQASGPSYGQYLVFGILPTSSRNQTQASDVVVGTIENKQDPQDRNTMNMVCYSTPYWLCILIGTCS